VVVAFIEPHWSHAMPVFGLQLAESLALIASKSEPKLMPFKVMTPEKLHPGH
jgi:hypothetical protein